MGTFGTNDIDKSYIYENYFRAYLCISTNTARLGSNLVCFQRALNVQWTAKKLHLDHV